jgi:hypothetical protein
VFNTTVGSNSLASTIGSSAGQSPLGQGPASACDGSISTKYVNFGPCTISDNAPQCGLNTGFYLELQRGASLVTGLQICTANDYPDRDPFSVTLEGSNQSGTALTFGFSWNLIYSGISGLQADPGRNHCGIVQLFNNTIQYQSYRFLASSKRNISDSIQYSEVQLFGY